MVLFVGNLIQRKKKKRLEQIKYFGSTVMTFVFLFMRNSMAISMVINSMVISMAVTELVRQLLFGIN